MLKYIKNKILSVKKYLWDDLWTTSEKSKSPIFDFTIKQIKILFVTIKGITEDKIIIKASALTYYSLLSVIPVVALAFGISKGFGFEKMLQEELSNRLQGQREVFDWITTFATRLLEHTQGELIAGVGVVFLVWSIMRLMSFAESSFNEIWEIKKGRTINRKLTDYFTIILISPVFFALSSSVTVYITANFDSISQSMKLIGFFGPLLKILFSLAPYLLVWILFIFIYMTIPNTKVKFRSALIAGIIAGTLFQIIQFLYLKFQISVSNYNAVYGSFAAFPLFMIWMHTAWLIVLFGVELSFSIQNFRKYEFEKVLIKLNFKSRRALYLLITSLLCKNFALGKKPSTIDDISDSLDIPQTICKDIIYKLNDIGVVSEVVNNTGFYSYQPAVDINLLSIRYVMGKIEDNGIDMESLHSNEEFIRLNKHLNHIDSIQCTSDANILLKDL